MKHKAISLALLLLGVAFCTLALNQLNQMSITNAQSELSKPIAEAQIAAQEQLMLSYGQSQEEIDKATKDAKELLDKTVSSLSAVYMQTTLIDGILGLVLLFAGVMTYPKEN